MCVIVTIGSIVTTPDLVIIYSYSHSYTLGAAAQHNGVACRRSNTSWSVTFLALVHVLVGVGPTLEHVLVVVGPTFEHVRVDVCPTLKHVLVDVWPVIEHVLVCVGPALLHVLVGVGPSL